MRFLVISDLHSNATGLAAALAAGLAQGVSLLDAVRSARAFVRKKIATASMLGGMSSAY